MTETFCVSNVVKLKAGTGVSTAITAAQYTILINQAEAALNVAAKIPNFNLVDEYAAMNTDVKLILEDGASSHAAVSATGFDLTGYFSESAAQFLSDINWTRYNESVKLIKSKKEHLGS